MNPISKLLAIAISCTSLLCTALCVLAVKLHGDRKAEDAAKNRWINENCIIVGFYGSSGQKRTLNCRGVLMREQDVPTVITQLPNPITKE